MVDLTLPNPGGPAVEDEAGQADGITNTLATPGEDNPLICDRTGFKVPVSKGLQKEWTGAMVRPESWEARHPLDFMRARSTERHSGSPRNEPADVFIDPYAGFLTDEYGIAIAASDGGWLEVV